MRHYLTGSKKRTLFNGSRLDIWQAKLSPWETGSLHPSQVKVARFWADHADEPTPQLFCVGHFANRDLVYRFNDAQNYIAYHGFYVKHHIFLGRWLAKERVVEPWYFADFLTDVDKIKEVAATYQDRVHVYVPDIWSNKGNVWFKDENDLVFAKLLYS